MVNEKETERKRVADTDIGKEIQEEIEDLNHESILISPGPKSPKEAGICLETIRHFGGKKPMLGICL